MERVNPLIITIDNEKYTLDFSRASISRAERKGFDMEKFGNEPLNSVSELFYYSFFMHHPNMTKEQTDKILFEDLEGLTKEEMERLTLLLEQTYKTLVREEERKNSRVTVEF